MKILFLGETEKGSAEYLRDSLLFHNCFVTHVDSKKELPPINEKYDVIIISDYPAASINETESKKIISQVENGTKFIMIGGWSSFNAKGINYNNHLLSDVLPVILSCNDDRKNHHQGIILCPAENIPESEINWQSPPVICGFNAVHTDSDSNVLIWGKKVQSDGYDISFTNSFPILVKGYYGKGITLAFMTDLAPHWCGGLVDWGDKRIKLKYIEVGDMFLNFIHFLLTVN